jgi:hypothetical protein
MMGYYDAHQIDSKVIGIGFKNPSEELKGKIIGNNEGTKDIPTRRFIPLAGETFTVSVMRKLKDVYARRIMALFK